MTPAEQHHAVVEQLVEAFNDHDRERLDPCYAEKITVHASTGDVRTMDHDEHWAEVERFYTVFPDVHARIDHWVGDDRSIFLRGSYTATHAGSVPGSVFAPSGQRATWAWWCEYRFGDDGRIVEAWNCYDDLTRLIEHGHWTPPGEDPEAA